MMNGEPRRGTENEARPIALLNSQFSVLRSSFIILFFLVHPKHAEEEAPVDGLYAGDHEKEAPQGAPESGRDLGRPQVLAKPVAKEPKIDAHPAHEEGGPR